MKVVVCGCSFSCSSSKIEYRGTHWSEILSNKYGHEVINLSKSGVSNSAIRLQIDEAIKLKPDLIIITTTTSARIEIPRTAWGKDCNTQPKITFIGYQGYDPKLGFNNIYHRPNNQKNFTMYSTSIISYLLKDVVEDEQQRKAVQYHINYTFDPAWKLQTDKWIIRDGINQIHLNGIPCILQAGFTWGEYNKDSEYDQEELVDFFKGILNQECIVNKEDSIFSMSKCEPEIDPGYHTSPEEQVLWTNVLVKNYIEKLLPQPQLV